MPVNFEINDSFAKALKLLNDTSQNIFVTGKAGTGKSTLLTYFRNSTDKKIVVLAPTGVAAVNIKGETIHSFFKFKPNISISEAARIGRGFNKHDLYKKLDSVVIDEISMVRADLIDCVDVFLREARGNTQPFGGVQMIFIGDLYQLPPVVQRDELSILKSIYESIYFFDSNVFKDLRGGRYSFELIELDKIYRQNDQRFIDILNCVRNKTITLSQLDKLNERYISNVVHNTEYIYLTARNDQSDTINSQNLDSLKTKMKCYFGQIDGDFKGKELPTDLALDLKLGARVMFLNNDTLGRWINGTIGNITVLGNDFVKVQIDDGIEVEVEQYKWSMYSTIFNEDKKEITRKEAGSFTQLPLRLAWAITIHKSQGKTFEKVLIDLGWGAFSHGQVYVALSRCTTYEGLILKKKLRLSDILVDKTIVNFMQSFTN